MSSRRPSGRAAAASHNRKCLFAIETKTKKPTHTITAKGPSVVLIRALYIIESPKKEPHVQKIHEIHTKGITYKGGLKEGRILKHEATKKMD